MTISDYGNKNLDVIKKYIDDYSGWTKTQDWEDLSQERKDHSLEFKRIFERTRIFDLSEKDIVSSFKKLWSYDYYISRIRYADHFFKYNDLVDVREQLGNFLWGVENISYRFDRFIRNVYGVGPGVASELLTLILPEKYIYWSIKARQALIELSWIPSEIAFQLSGERYQDLCRSVPKLRAIVSEYIPTIRDNLDLDLFLYRVAQVRTEVDNAYNFINEVIEDTSRVIVKMDLVAQEHKEMIDAAWNEALSHANTSIELLPIPGKAIDYHRDIVDAGLIGNQLVLKQRLLSQVKSYLNKIKKHSPTIAKIVLKLLNSLLGSIAMIFPPVHALAEIKEHFEVCVDLKEIVDK